MARIGSVAVAILVIGLGSVASAAVIPVTALQSSNSAGGGNIFNNAVNNQPATDPVAGTQIPLVDNSNTWAFFGDNRHSVLDFGSNFADVVINDVFAYQRTFGTADAPESYFWSTDTFYNNGNETAAPDFNLINYVGTGGDTRWINLFHSDAGVTPESRYLIVHRGVGGNEGNFKHEIVFVSNPVPEPTSLGLLAVVGLAALRRRRRR